MIDNSNYFLKSFRKIFSNKSARLHDPLFKGNENKKYSNKLMQLRVLLQFIAIIVLVGLAYFFKN